MLLGYVEPDQHGELKTRQELEAERLKRINASTFFMPQQLVPSEEDQSVRRARPPAHAGQRPGDRRTTSRPTWSSSATRGGAHASEDLQGGALCGQVSQAIGSRRRLLPSRVDADRSLRPPLAAGAALQVVEATRRRGRRGRPVDQGADPHPHRRRADHQRVRQHPLEQLRRRGLPPQPGPAAHRRRCRRPIRPARSCWSATATRARSTSGRSATRPSRSTCSSRRRTRPTRCCCAARTRPADTIVIRDKTPRQARGRPGRSRQARLGPSAQPHPRAEGDAGGDGLGPRADRHPRRGGQPADPAVGRGALLADAPLRRPRPDRREVPAARTSAARPMVLAEQEFDRETAGGVRWSAWRSRTTTCAPARAPTCS